jgi:hypothetical protein
VREHVAPGLDPGADCRSFELTYWGVDTALGRVSTELIQGGAAGADRGRRAPYRDDRRQVATNATRVVARTNPDFAERGIAEHITELCVWVKLR